MPFSAKLLVLPAWLLIALCVAIAAALAVGGLILAHKVVPAKVMKLHNEVAGFVFATVGVIYAVLLAFVVLVVWEQFNEAGEISAAEGATALALVRQIENFPDRSEADALKPLVLTYAARVVDCEYPAAARFEDCKASREALVALWKRVVSIVPETAGEEVVFGSVLSALTQLQQQRTLRQAQADHQIPDPVWAAILLGALLTISFTYLFGAENRWAQFIITGILGAMIGLVISTVILLDHPFVGDLSIKPNMYQHLLSTEQ